MLGGNAIINGHGIYIPDSNVSEEMLPPIENPRWDLVALDANSKIRIYKGVESNEPQVPGTPHNHIPLARIFHRVGEKFIGEVDDTLNGYIFDVRPIQVDNPSFVTNSNIGQIMAIHPDLKPVFRPNLPYWALCDGKTDLPDRFFIKSNDSKVPNLTDDRFLMGSPSYRVGGNNDGHSHGFSLSTTVDGNHAHTISGNFVTDSGRNDKDRRGGGYGEVSHTNFSGNHNHGVIGSIGFGPSGDTEGSNLVKHFAVLFYIRIQ